MRPATPRTEDVVPVRANPGIPLGFVVYIRITLSQGCWVVPNRIASGSSGAFAFYIGPMQHVITPGGLCFDIGAHHGESADKFLNHYGAGKVVCVEPCLDNFLKARDHWKDDPRVIPIHAALTRDPSLVSIHKAIEQDGLSTLNRNVWAQVYPGVTWAPPELVAGITFEELCMVVGQPDYIKVDVEGLEQDVIGGLCDYLDMSMSRQRPAVSFEFHGALLGQCVDCLKMLLRSGYTHAEYVPEDVDLLNVPNRGLEEVFLEIKDKRIEWGNITVRSVRDRVDIGPAMLAKMPEPQQPGN